MSERSESATTQAQPIRAVVLWSWPRTRSTVFERFFLARPAKDVDVEHEAMAAPMWWSRNRVSPWFDDATCAAQWPEFADATYESEWRRMTIPKDGKMAIFSKDHAKHVVVPEHPREGAPQPPDSKDDNPTYLRTKDLLASHVQHIFLIRDIRQSVPSCARLTMRTDCGMGFFSEAELGIRHSLKLYQFLEKHLEEPPLVIDSDDMVKDPEAVTRLLCKLLGVDFQPEMLSWPKDEKVEAMFKKWEGWHDEIATSTGVSGDLTHKDTWEVTAEMKAAIDKYWDDYMYLKERAYNFRSLHADGEAGDIESTVEDEAGVGTESKSDSSAVGQ